MCTGETGSWTRIMCEDTAGNHKIQGSDHRHHHRFHVEQFIDDLKDKCEKLELPDKIVRIGQ